MNPIDRILNYLRDTRDISGIADSLSALDSESSSSKESILSPWSIETIAINSGSSVEKVRETLSGMNGGSIKQVTINGINLEVFTLNGELPAQVGEDGFEFGNSSVHVNALMNLYLYQYSLSRIAEHDYPVKMEDALFDLKNTVFLPDDFMPHYLLGTVEGETGMRTSQVFDKLQIADGSVSLYVFSEASSEGTGRVRFIYPANSGKIHNAPDNDSIRTIIGGSFGNLRADKRYTDFENSRLVKNVLYSITQKGSRELRRPMFDPRKIAILDSMGLVDKSGEVPKVSESVAIEDLQGIISRQKQAGKELAEEWLESKVEVKL